MMTQTGWLWSAYGKHPAARDYFSIGQIFPLGTAFSEWIGSGYSAVNKDGRTGQGHISWRFWAHEPKTNNVVCGIARDSRDGVGRPYPLLIAGTGPLPDWNNNWDLLPFALENSWSQIEYISTKQFSDVRAFERELTGVRHPVNNWDQFKAESQRLQGVAFDAAHQHLLTLRENRVFVRLDNLQDDLFDLITRCHIILRAHTPATPNTVFMGGSMNRTSIAIFRRPLSISDFGNMWDMKDSEV